MLTIAYVFFALQLLAAGSPAPAPNGVQRISLTRRQPNNATASAADIKRIVQLAEIATAKYDLGFASFKENSGQDHPLVDGLANNSKRAVGTEPLVNDDGALFVGALSAGTPAQPFTVGFDTGSASMLLVNAACTSTDCQNHQLYDPSASSTATNRNQRFNLKVTNSETVAGNQYTDTVTVATLPATGQVLGASDTFPTSFSAYSTPVDGRVGMGFQAISAYKAPSLPQTLIAQGATSSPVFSFRLDANPELLLGAIDPTEIVGNIAYTPVTTKGFWQINVDSIQAGGQRSIGRTAAIVDTGSPFIIGDRSNVQKFYSTIPGSKAIANGLFTFPCATDPAAAITVAGVSFPIPLSSFSLGPVSEDSDQCVGAVMASSQTKPPQRYFSLGVAFLENAYTVLDMSATPRVGFAALR